MNRNWARIAAFLIVGYYSLSRSFAYLGIPPWNVFLGEVVLGYFLIFGPATPYGRWPWLAMKSQSLRRLVQSFLLLFAYGVFQVVRGMYLGNPPLSAVRDLAFDYYPLYLFLGLFVGLRLPSFLPKLVRLLAWVNGTYGVAYILLLNNVGWTMPGVSKDVEAVPVLAEPLGSAIALLGLLAFEEDVWSIWPLFLLNLFVLVGMQIRGEWLAFAVGLMLWGWMTKHIKQFAVAGSFLILFFGLMVALDVKMQGPEKHGGGIISARDLVGRAVAPVAPDLAAEYTSNSENASGTTLWRTVWWAEIFISVHESLSRAIVGYGYGFPLGDLVPYLRGQFIRTPHNVFLYALGYTGWLGVALFAGFQLQLLKLLRRSWDETGQVFGLIFWAATLIFASFTAFFEVPYGAIPFYLVTGAAIAPALSQPRGRVTRNEGGDETLARGINPQA